MAPVKTHIIFTGIVALVPRSNGVWRAVLKDVRTDKNHPHYAHILAEKDCVTADNGPDETKEHPISKRDLGIWFLNGAEIIIANGFGGGPVRLDDKYVVDMYKITSDYIDADEIMPSLLKRTAAVAGYLDFNGGTLQATWVHPYYEWVFVPKHGPQPGWTPVAQEVASHFMQSRRCASKCAISMVRPTISKSVLTKTKSSFAWGISREVRS